MAQDPATTAGGVPTGAGVPAEDPTVVRRPLPPSDDRTVVRTEAPAPADPGATVLGPRPEPVATPPACPVRRVGAYEVDIRLGEGGMGVVYRGVDTRLARLVAIKFMRDGAHASPEERERFLREPRAAAKLRHPGIVQIHDTGESDGSPWFAMEFLEGATLGRRIREGGLSFRETAEVIRKVAAALHYAHQNGVVHRDLKPENIMLCGDQPKVMDFGLAKSLSEISHTVSGTVMGTPHYMSPEQAGGEVGKVDARSDVYSLGVVLFECLTARLPFEHADPYEVLARIRRDEPQFPHRLRPEVPRDLEKVCLKAMAKERGHRYPAAGELAEDLGRWLEGLPVRAVPPSHFYRLRKLVFRNRRLVTAFGLGMAAVGAVLAIQVRESMVERERNARARLLREEAEASLPALVRESPDAEPFRRCAGAIEQALALTPEDAKLRLWRARANDRRGDPGAALADVERVLAVDPRHARARFMKAWLHWRRPGEQELAVQALEGWEACDPGPELAPAGSILREWRQNGQAAAAQCAEKTVSHWPADPEFQALLYAVIGRSVITSAMREHSAWLIPRLDEYLVTTVDDAQALMLRATARLHLGDEDRAVADVNRALAVNPREWGGLDAYVDFLRNEGRWDETERWLETARRTAMPESKRLAQLARVALGRGDLPRARAHGLDALRAAGTDPWGVTNALQVLEDLHLGGPDLEAVQGILRALPPEMFAQGDPLGLSMRLVRLGLRAEAESLVERVIAAGVAMPEVHRMRARLYTETDRRDEARAEWTRLLALEPVNHEAYAERARLGMYDLLKKPGAAKQVVGDLTRALECGSGDEDLLLIRAALRLLMRKRPDAVRDVAEYAERHAQHELAADWLEVEATWAKRFPWLVQNVKSLFEDVAAELVRRGEAAAAAGAWVLARRVHSHALFFRPDHPPALIGLAQAATRDDPQAAILYLEKAVAHGADPAAIAADERFSSLRPFPGFRALGN